MHPFELIVGNVGTLRYETKEEAIKDYHEYVIMSKSCANRAAGEQVILFEGDSIIREYHPDLGEN